MSGARARAEMSASEPGRNVPAPPSAPATATVRHDVGVAVRNTATLALSLLCTWSVALFVRFLLPRHMGPLSFGAYTFADGFAFSFMTFLELGVDFYIQKEVSVRPEHASDFIGGFIALRAIVATALVAVMLTVLRVTERPAEVQATAMLFAVTYFLMVLNNTFGTLLQSSTRVGRLALANVISKVVWGAGVVVCILLDVPMMVFACPLLASEILRSVMLTPAARAAVDLRFRIDAPAVLRTFVASLPYFISSATIGVTGRLNIALLEYLAADKREVGWLGAATNIGSLSMILSPLLPWVLLPMLARARARSTDEVYLILSFALECVLVIAIPIALFIGIGADLWVRLAFGAGYAQSALSLEVIAPQFVFTYTAMTVTAGLVILDMQWKATRNALLALVITPVFILAMVPALSRLGEGGAAMGAATAVAFSEIVISASCLYYVGRRAVSGRASAATAKSIAVGLLVIALDHVLRRSGMWLSYLRIVVDMVAYVVGVLAIGAVRVREVTLAVRSVRASRANKPAVEAR
jgi:O-antigen/teichoic acid export membrane protein